jgi:hypothetical protein
MGLNTMKLIAIGFITLGFEFGFFAIIFGNFVTLLVIGASILVAGGFSLLLMKYHLEYHEQLNDQLEEIKDKLKSRRRKGVAANVVIAFILGVVLVLVLLLLYKVGV